MATQTRTFHAYESVGVLFEYDYDDVSMLVQVVRCINNTALDAFAELTVDDASPRNRGRSYSQRFGPGTTTLSVPQGAAQRVELAPGGDGVPVGCFLTLKWPAD